MGECIMFNAQCSIMDFNAVRHYLSVDLQHLASFFHNAVRYL